MATSTPSVRISSSRICRSTCTVACTCIITGIGISRANFSSQEDGAKRAADILGAIAIQTHKRSARIFSGTAYLAALGNAHSGVIVFIDDSNKNDRDFLLAHTGPVDQARGPVLKVIHSSHRAPRDDMQRNIQVHRNFRPAAHSRVQYACKHVPIRCTQYFTCRVR